MQQEQRRISHRGDPRRPGGRKKRPSLLRALNNRSATGNSRGVELWAEDESVFHQQLEDLDLSAGVGAEPTRSTIAVAFSTDGKLFASTHGDHTVKVTNFLRGRVVQTLRGHPRTPWTVKFHPKDSRIVASGCIGSEVRVWNTWTGQCLYMATLEAAIISLSFHPSGRMLAMASSLYVYLWDYKSNTRPFVAWAHSHTLRCVRFTPGGDGIIVGAANNSSVLPSPQQSQNPGTDTTGGRGMRRAATAPAASPQPRQPQPRPAEVTFRLQVWDFSLEAALAEDITSAMTRDRVLLSRALMYNDCGFDVSKDGLWLCAIAELRQRAAGDCPPLPPDPSFGSGSIFSAIPSTATATAATTPMATLTEVEEVGGEDEAEVDASSSAAVLGDYNGHGCDPPGRERPGAGNMVGGESSCSSCSRSDSSIFARKDGSQLSELGHRTPPAVLSAGRVAPSDAFSIRTTLSATGQALAAASSQGRRGCAGVGGIGQYSAGATTGGREQDPKKCEGGERGRGTALAPWPSRTRPRRYFSGALSAAAQDMRGRGIEGARYGHNADTSGVEAMKTEAAEVAAILRPETEGNERPPTYSPPPLTPSPRITLKRRLSGSWLSAIGGGCSSAGSSGGPWGRELRRGGSPRLSHDERGGSGGGGYVSEQEGDRPPPLPPPSLDFSGRGRPPSSPPFSCASPVPSPLSMSSHVRPPLRPSWVPPTTLAAVPSSSSSSSLSIGLRISLPLLLPPPPRPSDRLSTGAGSIGPSLGATGAIGETRQQQRQNHEKNPGEQGDMSQPLFFLQVPGRGTSTAAGNLADLGGGWSTQYSRGSGGADRVQHASRAARVTYRRGEGAGGGGVGEEELRPKVLGGSQGRDSGDGSGGGSVGAGEARCGETSRNIPSSNNHGGGGSSISGAVSFGRARSRASPLSSFVTAASQPQPTWKLVPHLVLVSLNVEGARGGAGCGKAARVVRAEPMDTLHAKQVTSVKLSPSARYILLGVGVRGGRGGAGGGGGGVASQTQQQAAATDRRGDAATAGPAVPSQHALSSIYRSADLQAVNSMPMPTAEEDVNIACFHPEPGMGCVYGTNQGKVGLVRMGD